MKKPKFMLANLSKSWGGGEKWFLTVAQGLQKQGFEVCLLVYPGSALASRAQIVKVPTLSVKLRFLHWFLPGRMKKLRRLIHYYQPDTILLNASHELKTVGIMARRMGISQIVLRRGVSYPISQNALNRWVIRTVPTHFLANSHATFEAFEKAFPHIRTLPHLTLANGIDPEKWQVNRQVRQVGHMAMLARLSQEKGIDRAIAAMALIKKTHPKAVLNIWGEGPQFDALKKQIIALNLAQQVKLHGFLDDVMPALNQCQFFVFTPRFGEGTSLALIEAMLLELPCIVFDSPAMAEVVQDGETGFVVADGQIEALAEKIRYLLEQPERCQQMGQKAREYALNHFGLDRIIRSLTDWLAS